MEAFAAERLATGFPLGSGDLDVITPADPAAGANLTLTLNMQRIVIVRSLYIELTTSAAAANRAVTVDYLLGARFTAATNGPGVVVTASSTSQGFQFDGQHTFSDFATGTVVFVPLLQLPLHAGWGVRVSVANIDVADQLANCRVVVERFYRPRDDD